MFRYFILLYSLIGALNQGVAQTISIFPKQGYCPGTMALAEFNANTVQFGSGNQFTVTLESINGKVSRELSATAISGYQLRLQYPNDVAPDTYRLTLRSSDPTLVSAPSQPFLISPKPTVTLRSVTQSIMGPFEPVPIEYTYTGPADAVITLNDGSIIRLGSFTYSPPQTTRRHLIRPAESGTYSVSKVTTETCGNGVASGEVPVQVSPVGIRLVSVLPKQICAGSQFHIAYSASGSFEAGNRFTIQLIKNLGEIIAQFPAESTPNGLTATMPESIPPYDYYDIIVLADKPTVMSRLGSWVSVRRKPFAQLELGTINSMYGATVELPMMVSGKEPIAITLSDGTVLDRRKWQYRHNKNEAVEQSFVYPVRPTQTTTYRIQSFSTGCGGGSTSGVFTVQVGAGLTINSTTSLTACAGTGYQVPVTVHGNLPSTNRLSVRIAYNQPEYPYKADTLVVPATLDTGLLRFITPTIMGNTSFRIEGTGLASASDWHRLLIQSAPRLTTFRITEIDGRSILQLAFNGVLPVTFALNDGKTYATTILPNASWNMYEIPLKGYPTSTFNVVSLSNVCGPGVATATSIQYVNPNPVRIRLNDENPKTVCIGSTATIAFDVAGTTAASTSYVIQLGSYDYTTKRFAVKQTIGSGTQSPVQVKVGQEPLYDTFIRVVTTDPLSISDPEPFVVQKPAIASYFPNGRTVPLSDEQGEFNGDLGISGGRPFILTFTDGKAMHKAFLFDKNSTPNYGFTDYGNYYLESVQNGCGFGTIRSTDTLYVRPFNIKTELAERSILCAGGLASIPFSIAGDVPNDASFIVQISRYRNGGFYDLMPLASPYPGQLLVRLPDTLRHSNMRLGGDYNYIRVVSKNKDVVGSVVPIPVFVRRPVMVSLSSNGSTVYDPSVGALPLRINATGSTPFSAFIDNRSYASESYTEDGQQFTNDMDTDETTRPIVVAPRQKTTYSLRTAYNQCGYGTVSGQVTVSVKPKINIQIGSAYTTGICAGSLLSLTATLSGDFESDNQIRVLVSTSSGSSIHLDDREVGRFDSSVGTLQIQIPTSLSNSVTYYIKAVSTRPDNVFSNAEPIQIVESAAAILEGNTTIHSGEYTRIRLKVSGGAPYQYELSTGQTGNVSADAEIEVQPGETTSYTIRSIQNACGRGLVSGSARVEVLPPMSATLSLARAYVPTICAGAQVRLPLTVNGVISGNATFQVQMSDVSGLTYQDIPTVAAGTSLTATIPTDVLPGTTYRLRVRVPGTNLVSSANLNPITVLLPASATISGPPYFESGKPISLTVNLTGSSPWSLTLSDSLQLSFLTAVSTPYVHTVYPNRFATYRLTRVSNACGNGTLGTPSAIQIGLLTANYYLINESQIRLKPNPVLSVLRIDSDLAIAIRNVQVINSQGAVMVNVPRLSRFGGYIDISMLEWPAGVYLIRCETDKGLWVGRAVKQ